MNFTRNVRTEILRMTLEGLTDKEISKRLKPRIRETKLVYGRTHGSLVKRKPVLNFIISHTLVRLGNELECNGCEDVEVDFIVRALNRLEVKTPTLRSWTQGNLKRFLQQHGITGKLKRLRSSVLSSLITQNLSDIEIYNEEKLDPEDFIPSIETINFDPVARRHNPEIKGTRKKILKLEIEAALENGCTMVSHVTDYLNDQGLKNAAGKKFSRWSVKLLMQEFGLDCHDRKDAEIYRPIMEDWIRTHPITKEISKAAFVEKVRSFQGEKELFKNINHLYSSLSSLVMEHNKEYRQRMRGEEYRDKVEHAVYVKYRHRPITAEEIGKELGLSTMQGNRIMRDYLRIDPFDVWYENLYKLVKDFLKVNPVFLIDELAVFLEASYLSTQRGNSWDYSNTQTTYLRLQKRYPDLPNSKGRRV